MVSWIIEGIARWHRRRTTIRELQNLSDYYLTDIGLDRSQIVSTVEEMVDGRFTPAAVSDAEES
ncbi:DUF1127 domain-containing protein [Pelagibius sp. Alg239-R121]|uniref:DUF1127 domain-containing protein n=1 Tax=Pelagibius sp. Alg239-R121 TaxID=2993448 RepID=UPI0024A6DF73|nr:DUF1127 domain-containing protein [Pelagibius sp. Alg239-R121]